MDFFSSWHVSRGSTLTVNTFTGWSFQLATEVRGLFCKQAWATSILYWSVYQIELELTAAHYNGGSVLLVGLDYRKGQLALD